MLVKFIERWTGSAQAAADYLLRETDSQSAVHDDVAAVADALEFEHKYTSGVPGRLRTGRATWTSTGVLDEFEQTAWAGLGADLRPPWSRRATSTRA